MLIPLNNKGKPKSKKDMSPDELASLARAERRADDHQIDVALRKKTRDEARKALGT